MNWLRRFMYGRYGLDQLSMALFIAYLIVWMLERILNCRYLAILTAALMLWCIFRVLSRNHAKRAAENAAFLRILNRIKAMLHIGYGAAPTWQTADYRYDAKVQQKKEEKAAKKAKKQQKKAEKANFCHFDCPTCRQTLRVPRGKGKIQIHCPKCGTEFIKKT